MLAVTTPEDTLESRARESLAARKLTENITYSAWMALPFEQRARIREIGCQPWFEKGAPFIGAGFDPACVHPDDPCQSKGRVV